MPEEVQLASAYGPGIALGWGLALGNRIEDIKRRWERLEKEAGRMPVQERNRELANIWSSISILLTDTYFIARNRGMLKKFEEELQADWKSRGTNNGNKILVVLERTQQFLEREGFLTTSNQNPPDRADEVWEILVAEAYRKYKRGEVKAVG